MGKHRNSKKHGITKNKLLPHNRAEVSIMVDQLFKKCTNVPQSDGSHTITQEPEKFRQIYELVERIREKEKDVKLPVYDREQQIEPFLQWLNKNNIEMNGTEIVSYENEGFGLRTKKPLSLGDLVISVPIKSVMSEETAKKSYLAHLIAKDPILQHMKNVTMSLHLLGEFANPNSFWQPYIRILPSSYDSVLYFTPEDMKLLAGSPLYDESLKQYQNIARQYSYFYRILHTIPEARSWPIKDYFTFDAYRWAVSTVMTRLNKIPSSKSPGQFALIPAWDLANHECGEWSTDFDEDGCVVKCYAQRNFSVGDQFTIHYGERPNAEFFLHSGFVYFDNPNDSLSLKLGVSKGDPLYEEKVNLLTAVSMPQTGTFNLVPGKHPISPDLLCFTRIFSMDKESLDFWTKCDSQKAKDLRHEDCDVGTLVQDKAMKFLHTRVSLLMRAYPNTFEEDEQQLNSEEDRKKRLILSLLIEEKKVLRDALVHLSAVVTK